MRHISRTSRIWCFTWKANGSMWENTPSTNNATDFSRVYGEYYLAEYQIERPLQYWQVVKDHWDQESFTLETVYDNPEGLEAAAAELLDFHAFLAEQCPEADVRYLFTFRSPVCPDRPVCRLALVLCTCQQERGMGPSGRRSGTWTAELAVWSVSYGSIRSGSLRRRWRQPWTTPRRRNTTARTSTSGHGLSPIRSGGTASPAHPPSERYTFAEIYRLLEALEWETLEGTETDFSFTGADGSLYAFPMTCGRTSMDICSAAVRRTVSRRKTARTMVRSPSGGAWRR